MKANHREKVMQIYEKTEENLKKKLLKIQMLRTEI